MNSLQNKVILITGGLGRLGRSAMSMFLRKGASVAICDLRSFEEFPDIVKLHEQYGDERLLFIQSNATDENQVQSATLQIENHFGRLDGLYHNSYTNIPKTVLELTLEEWELQIRGTLTSTFLVCKYSLPLMIHSGGGSIVITSSVLSQQPKLKNAAYGASKAGVNHFTRNIAKEYADQGIRANTILPGDFMSDEEIERMSETARERKRQMALLGRTGRTDEVNEVAAFLLSDAACYVTASLYTVDGGFHL